MSKDTVGESKRNTQLRNAYDKKPRPTTGTQKNSEMRFAKSGHGSIVMVDRMSDK
jgi:hypothetical protein